MLSYLLGQTRGFHFPFLLLFFFSHVTTNLLKQKCIIFISPSCDHQSQRSGPESFIGCVVAFAVIWVDAAYPFELGAMVQILRFQPSRLL